MRQFPWNRVCFSRHKENDKADGVWRGGGAKFSISQVHSDATGRNAVCWEGVIVERVWLDWRSAFEDRGQKRSNKMNKGNRELGRQMFPKAHPEGVGDPDLRPQLEFHMLSGTWESLQDLGLKEDLEG